MVNYHDPLTVAREFTTVVKFWHVVDGIFIWEFFTILDYEWDVFRRHRPYRWTIWVYSMARVSTLLAIILNMVDFDTTTSINCQLWVTFEASFAYLAFVASSLLIVLRIIVIWNRQNIVFALAMGMWVTEISLFIYAIARLRSTWSPELNTCALLNLESSKPAIIGVLVTDIVLLLTMLIGLLRMRLKAGGAFGLARILWKQGLMWLLLATVAEVPPTTFMLLNLNVALDLMPQTPTLIIVTIAATRLYRSLINFGSSEILHETPPGGGRTLSEMRARSGSIPLNRTEVSVRTECARYPASCRSSCDSSISTEPQGHDKTHEASLDADLERGLEK